MTKPLSIRKARAQRVAARLESKAFAMDLRFKREEEKRAKAKALEQARADRAYKRLLAQDAREFREQNRNLIKNYPNEVYENLKSRHSDAKRRYIALKMEEMAAKEFNLPDDPDAQTAYQDALALSKQAYKECQALYVRMKSYEAKAKAWKEQIEDQNRIARQRILEQNTQDLTTG